MNLEKSKSETTVLKNSTKLLPVYKGAANYKLHCKVGEGAVGEVFRVVHKQTQEIYALKRVSKISATMVSIQFDVD